MAGYGQPAPGPGVAAKLAVYRSELLRWQKSFSLVSRVDPEARIDALIAESRSALYALTAGGDLGPTDRGEAAPGEFRCVDIGSGAGFPGLVWAVELESVAPRASVLLVEPREHRAWFLERAIRKLQLGGTGVVQARWGDDEVAGALAFRMSGGGASPAAGERGPDGVSRKGPASPFTSVPLVVTLKALRLGDVEILLGIDPAVAPAGTRVHVVRFLPGATTTGEATESMPRGWKLLRRNQLDASATGDGTRELSINTYEAVIAG
ncbi:MAG: RsmG family class I SAM-dependent methyltransferase [Candidatus Krumholzibacteriia bacterium]